MSLTLNSPFHNISCWSDSDRLRPQSANRPEPYMLTKHTSREASASSQRRSSVKSSTSLTLSKQPEAQICIACDQLLRPRRGRGDVCEDARSKHTHLQPPSVLLLLSLCDAFNGSMSITSSGAPTAGEAPAKKNTREKFTNLPLFGPDATENKVLSQRRHLFRHQSIFKVSKTVLMSFFAFFFLF